MHQKLEKADLKISIATLCYLGKVSESEYYKWRKSSERRKAKLEKELLEYELIMNYKNVIRIMIKYGLVCKIRRKKFYGNTFNQQRIENTYKNLLDTTFDCIEPDALFHTDIPYIKYT